MSTANHAWSIIRLPIHRRPMRKISKTLGLSICPLIILTVTAPPPAAAHDIVLASPQGPHVSIDIKNRHVVAKDKGKNITYNVDTTVARLLRGAYDIRLISNESVPKARLFMVLAREPSRPGAMGLGYCGAGYEDYLLLVEILERKLLLRDQLLIQSCLKSISMFIDHGDDSPQDGMRREKDGSFSYRLLDDDYDKKRILTVERKRFKIALAPASAD